MHPEGYFALVLTPSSAELLARNFATLPDVLCHHSTVRHGTSDPADLPPPFGAADLGRTFRLRVVGVATRADAGLQAVAVALVGPDGALVERGFSVNPIPHVTVATDGAADAVEANALLEAGYTPVDGPTIEAVLVHTRESRRT